MKNLHCYILKFSAILGLALILTPSFLYAEPRKSGIKDRTKDSKLYYSVRPDYRRCISPLCGGYWVSAVNKELTRCADKTLASECYVAEIDWNNIGLDGSEGTTLVFGSLDRKRYKGFGALGTLLPTDAWRPASLNEPKGDWYGARDNGIRCITFPCYNIDERKLNSDSVMEVSGVDLSSVPANQDDLDAAWNALANDELIVVGVNVIIHDEGPAGEGKTLKASNFYVRVQTAKDDPLFCDTVDDCTLSVYHSFVSNESDCYCTTCPAPLNKEATRINQDSYQTHCSDYGLPYGSIDRIICPQVLCVEPPPLGCVNNQCVYIDDGSGLFDHRY